MEEKFGRKIIQKALKNYSQILCQFQKEVQIWENELAQATSKIPIIFQDQQTKRQLLIVEKKFKSELESELESEFPIEFYKIQNNNINTKQLLEATQLILKYQGQLKDTLNQINSLKSYQLKYATIKSRHISKKYLKNNKSPKQSKILQNQPQTQNYLKYDKHEAWIFRASQKEEKTLRKVQNYSQILKYQNKQIQNVSIIKEFQQNVSKIIYVKPPQPMLQNFSNKSNDSDSEIQQFLKRDYTPTPKVDNKINVQKGYSLLLIQLDVRSTLYQQLLPQINELSLSHNAFTIKGDENQNISQDKSLSIKQFVIDEPQAQNFQQHIVTINDKDDIIKQIILRISTIIDKYLKKQVIYNLKTYYKLQQPYCWKNIRPNQQQVTEQFNQKITGSQSMKFIQEFGKQYQIQQSLVQPYIRRLTANIVVIIQEVKKSQNIFSGLISVRFA
ncbi:hypothetical protein pb186bvf_008285 [Paramecium bursaria]